MAPLLISTWSFGMRGHNVAWPTLHDDGNALDAVETVCRVIDADPDVDSVGCGGLPDSSGRMTLDGCIMRSPAQCGAVCAISRHLHPVSIARHVMDDTAHVMLAGNGADDFADQHGHTQAELLSDDARRKWDAWVARPTTVDQSRDRLDDDGLRPVDTGDGGQLFRSPDDEARWKNHDTIGVIAIDAEGLAGACSTSGLPFKVPGRVGDSPIIGHGLYVDPHNGAAVATGSGELIMGVCGAFLAVEQLRSGIEPTAAVTEVLRRIADSYDLEPEHQVGLIVVRPDGQFASGSLRPGFRVSVTTPDRNEVIKPDVVLEPEDA